MQINKTDSLSFWLWPILLFGNGAKRTISTGKAWRGQQIGV